MLLLYPVGSLIGALGVIGFTFHYASTLSERSQPPAGARVYIYIPLCFYFIRSSYHCPSHLIHLHSTMLLLYRRNHKVIGYCEINLHSTMLLLYQFDGEELVISYTDLHSTMLLLYPSSNTASSNPSSIYIPLCFYFIVKQSQIEVKIIQFTFHYASTLSVLNLFQPGFFLQFTFHYASTLSVPTDLFHKSAFLIYIPLCFYFIHDLVEDVAYLDKDLHSTMLLLYPVPVFPFYFLQYKYTFCLPHFLHISLLKNLPPPTLQNLNFL